MPVVEEREEHLPDTYSYASQSSQDRYSQTEVEPERIFIHLSDAITQVLDWQSFSNDELHDELAFRLSNYQFAMGTHYPVPFVRCYERKDVYKRWGAIFDGDTKQWYLPLGSNLREILRQHPGWLHSPEQLRREILLRIMSEVDRNPTLVK